MNLKNPSLQIVRKRGLRRICLRVKKDGALVLSLPWYVSEKKGLAFVAEKAEWIAKTRQKIQARESQYAQEISLEFQQQGYATREDYVKALREAARAYLPLRTKVLADRYGFSPNSLRIKHNKTNWGSCSAKKNINLNLNLMRLPSHLCDYVILHELTHLTHPNHGPDFHRLLEELCADWCRQEYPSLVVKYQAALENASLHRVWRNELKIKKLL